MSLPDLPLGDWATWVGSISTTGALLAASWVVWIEMKRERRADTDRKSAQANLVAAWYEATGDEEPDWIVCRNGSALPVYDVEATMVGPKRDSWPRRYLPLGAPAVLAPGEMRLQVPGEAYSGTTESGGLRILFPEDWGISLSFVDAAGRVWFRDAWDGRLEPGGERTAKDGS